ncbi:MAG: hypothetical protein M3416_00515 [Acidobacteriota bacterium]|nr:hypothetical protein [Acidobacteriota bacterium]
MSSAEERLRNPPPGSRAAAARDFGVDLTLLIERLRKTPEERVRNLQSAVDGLEKMRGKARRKAAARPRAEKAQELT